MAQAVLAFFINLFTARYLGPSGYGLISYAASVVAFVVPIMNLGVNNILVNEFIKTPKREGEILGTSIVMTLTTSVFCIIGIATFVIISSPGEKDTLWVCVLYSLLLIFQSIEIVQYWFQAKFWSKYVSLCMLFSYLVVSAYKIFLLATNKSIFWFAISNAFDYCLIAFSLLIIYKIKGGQRLQFSFDVAKELFSQGKHYIIAGVMGVVLAQSDRVMLKTMLGNEEVGIYSAAYAIAGLTSFIFTAIVDSARPQILENKLNNGDVYEKSVSKLYGVVIYLAMAQSLFISVFAPTIIDIMYGADYYHAIPVLYIIVWYSTFSYIGGVRAVWVLAEKLQKYLWIVSLTGMILNIALNFVFIPMLGAIGAAIATLITQIFSNFIINYFVKKFKETNTLLIKGLNIFTLINKK